MPPKGNPIDISAASVVDLKAQLAQQNEQFQRIRAAAKYGPASDRRSDKKPTVWARQNKGVSSRSQRDEVQHIEQVESQSLERSRAALERKAKIYEQMRKRVRRDNDDEDDEDVLIDFDRKYWEERDREGKEDSRKRLKHGDDDDDDDDDPWVEYEDEFGRTRTVRRSQVPRERSPSPAPSYESRSPSPGPPPPPRESELADRSGIRHYDSTREVRTRGVGFYQFALDDEERAEQMERLAAMRQETEAARKNSKSVAERRKAILQSNAKRIHARRAELEAKKKGTTTTTRQTVDDEERVANFLKSVRESMNK